MQPIQPKGSLFVSRQAIADPNSIHGSKFLEREGDHHWEAFFDSKIDQDLFQDGSKTGNKWLRKLGHVALFFLIKWTPSFVGAQVLRLCIFFNNKPPVEVRDPFANIKLFKESAYEDVYSEIDRYGNKGLYHESIEKDGSNQFVEDSVEQALNIDMFSRNIKSHRVTIALPDKTLIVLNPEMNPLKQNSVEEAKIQFPKDKEPQPIPENVEERVVTTCTEALDGDAQRALRLLFSISQTSKITPSSVLTLEVMNRTNESVFLMARSAQEEKLYHQEMLLDLEKQTLHCRFSIDFITPCTSDSPVPIVTVHLDATYDLSDPNRVPFKCSGSWEERVNATELNQDEKGEVELLYKTLKEILGPPIATS